MAKSNCISLMDLEEWVENDEGLYTWWKSSRKTLRQFVRENRDALRVSVRAVLNAPPRS